MRHLIKKLLKEEINLHDVLENVIRTGLLYLSCFFPIFALILAYNVYNYNGRFLHPFLQKVFAELFVLFFVFYFFLLLAFLLKRPKILIGVFLGAFICYGVIYFLSLCLSRLFIGQLNNVLVLIEYIPSTYLFVKSGRALVSLWESFFLLVAPFASAIAYYSILYKKVVKDFYKIHGLISLPLYGLILYIAIPILSQQKSLLMQDIFVNSYLIAKQSEAIGEEVSQMEIKALRKLIDSKAIWISSDYPLLRLTQQSKSPNHIKLPPQTNIVLIVLESLSALNTGFNKFYRYKDVNVTPFIDDLMSESLIFPQFFANTDYTAGAEVALLCSIYDSYRYTNPLGSIMRNKTRMGLLCLPKILKKKGYKTYFFNGYKETFDNKHIFMRINGFDEMITLEDFRKVKRLKWGVPDKILYKKVLDTLEDSPEPFFTLIVTVGSHIPFEVPDKKFQIFPEDSLYHKYLNSIYYSDQSLAWFIKKARKKSWFDKTLFIITSDNGQNIFHEEEGITQIMRLMKTHRVPLLFYSPGYARFFKGKSDTLASQVDIAPTILDMLDITVANPFVGKSLFDSSPEKRYVFMMYWPDHYFWMEDNCLYDLNHDQVYKMSADECNLIAIKLKQKVLTMKTVINKLIVTNKIYPINERDLREN